MTARVCYETVTPPAGEPETHQPLSRIVPWVVSAGLHAGLIGLYQGADLLAFPSVWHEPFGIPIVEAMACGLPVVATRGGGVPEIIEDGETGILVERGDAAALAQGIIRLLGDDALRARMGRAGRRRAVERFSWETVAENLLACYERVLGATP